VLISVGPSIGPCCYDHKTPERFDLFKKYKDGAIKHDGKLFINLWDAIEQDLLEFGILPENFENPRVCTGCRNNGFASHHIEGDQRKTSNVSVIGMV
ncbi:MAG: laccase domain-containing protein, partial [Patescibacteria group bacterium]|nr:laccase domain-containing protein [Patescibacteria group bacterium]